MRTVVLRRAGRLGSLIALIVLVLSAAAPGWAGERLVNGKGLLWKIQRDGVDPSWVLGTMHVTDTRVTSLRKPLVEVLSKVDSLSLELIIHDRLLEDENEAWKLPEGRRLRDIIGPRMFGQVADRLGVYGLGKKHLDQYKPWVVANFFGPGSPEIARRNSGMIFFDHLLQLIAADRGARVFALETPKEQLDVFDGMPMRLQVDILRHAMRHTKRGKSEFERMVNLYLKSDVEAILGMTRGDKLEMPEFSRVLDRRMLDQRNKNMVDRMAQRLTEGNALIAVGAAHLPGREGVLNRLAEKGYSLTRVY